MNICCVRASSSRWLISIKNRINTVSNTYNVILGLVYVFDCMYNYYIKITFPALSNIYYIYFEYRQYDPFLQNPWGMWWCMRNIDFFVLIFVIVFLSLIFRDSDKNSFWSIFKFSFSSIFWSWITCLNAHIYSCSGQFIIKKSLYYNKCWSIEL